METCICTYPYIIDSRFWASFGYYLKQKRIEFLLRIYIFMLSKGPIPKSNSFIFVEQSAFDIFTIYFCLLSSFVAWLKGNLIWWFCWDTDSTSLTRRFHNFNICFIMVERVLKKSFYVSFPFFFVHDYQNQSNALHQYDKHDYTAIHF